VTVPLTTMGLASTKMNCMQMLLEWTKFKRQRSTEPNYSYNKGLYPLQNININGWLSKNYV